MKPLIWISLMLAATLLPGCNRSIEPPSTAGNDRWTAEETAALASLRLAQLPPAKKDPTNRVDGLPAAIELGRQLFFDPRFSRNQQVSCGTCHSPAKQFQDDLPLSKGVGTTARRSMPLMGLAYSPWLFWDGRKDSLWAQALGPMEDPNEHGGNRLQYAHLMQANYRAAYEAVFGLMPDLQKLPRSGGPLGSAEEQAAWGQLNPADQQAVSQVFANMGKAIAAYVGTLHYGESRLDQYIDGVLRKDSDAMQVLTPQEKAGLRVFIGKGQCITCHNGPLLTDQHFHNTGVPPRHGAAPDQGRIAATAKVLRDEFNCLGRYSDAPANGCQELRFIVANDPKLVGAFKTPSLRNIVLRPPYMHAGQIATLQEVITHYAAAPKAAIGSSERTPMQLSDDETAGLLAFLATLSGPVIERPPQ